MSNKGKKFHSYPAKMKVETVEFAEINGNRAKFVSCIIHVRRVKLAQIKAMDKFAQIIAMDETLVWKDMVSVTTIDATDEKSITMKSTGHEKFCVLVCLAAKADGTKFKPMVVFKSAVR